MKFIEPSLVGTSKIPSFITVRPGDLVQALLNFEASEGADASAGYVYLVSSNSERDDQVDLIELSSGEVLGVLTVEEHTDAPGSYALDIGKWRKLQPKGKIEFVPCL